MNLKERKKWEIFLFESIKNEFEGSFSEIQSKKVKDSISKLSDIELSVKCEFTDEFMYKYKE